MKYRIDNIVINSDHIVDVEYDPERSGIDDETGKQYHNKSRCTITLMAIERDPEVGYEGAIYGVGSMSQTISLRGTNADAFWNVYSGDALDVIKTWLDKAEAVK